MSANDKAPMMSKSKEPPSVADYGPDGSEPGAMAVKESHSQSAASSRSSKRGGKKLTRRTVNFAKMLKNYAKTILHDADTRSQAPSIRRADEDAMKIFESLYMDMKHRLLREAKDLMEKDHKRTVNGAHMMTAARLLFGEHRYQALFQFAKQPTEEMLRHMKSRRIKREARREYHGPQSMPEQLRLHMIEKQTKKEQRRLNGEKMGMGANLKRARSPAEMPGEEVSVNSPSLESESHSTVSAPHSPPAQKEISTGLQAIAPGSPTSPRITSKQPRLVVEAATTSTAMPPPKGIAKSKILPDDTPPTSPGSSSPQHSATSC